MQKLKLYFLMLLILILNGNLWAQLKCNEIYGRGENRIVIATGSPGELGLLKVLAERFSEKHNVSICWIKAGSGEALQMLKNKSVDLILVHAPSSEIKAVAEGWATKRTLIGSNEFYIVGPKNDPAKVAESKSVITAYQKIASTKALFLSRGDNSGTHKKEIEIWERAGYLPNPEKDKWYIVTKASMGESLKKANKVKGYFMTDSSTWIVMKKDLPNLKILFKGDEFLINLYHALCQENCSPYASKFIDFLASEEGQEIIRNFGKNFYGEPLYNDAEDTKKMVKAFTIKGTVKNWLDLNLEALKSLPAYEVTLVEVTKDERYHGTFVYKGVSLKDLLNIAKILTKEKKFPKFIDTGIIVRNEEGKEIFIAWGEIFHRNPEKVILAYSYRPVKPHFLDCSRCHAKKFYQPVLAQLDRTVKLPKLVISDDFYTDRSIEGVKEIEVVELNGSTMYNKIQNLYSDKIAVYKNGKKITEIKELVVPEKERIRIKILGEGGSYYGIKSFEGVELKEVIENFYAGNNLNGAVIVYGADGYRSVFSLGEIFLSKEKTILADKIDGASIKNGGKFVMVSSGDIFANRMVKAVSRIEIVFPALNP